MSGLQNSSGEQKTAIFQRIGQALFPAMYEQEPKTVADRVKSKIEWYVQWCLIIIEYVLTCHRLTAQYQKHAKRLQVTGAGIGNSDSEGDMQDGPNQFMDFYIATSGPDDSTSEHAKNLWCELC